LLALSHTGREHGSSPAISLGVIGRFAMHIRKTLIALLALAIAVAFSPLGSLQAASPLGPNSEPGTENLTYTVAAKKKAKKKSAKKPKKSKKAKKSKGKKVASKGPGRCGVGKYFKGGKCLDAAAKK
jgi:hypothetical protein